MKVLNLFSILLVILLIVGCGDQNKEKEQSEKEGKSKSLAYQLPPNNPYLIQNSKYPSVHFNPAQSDATDLPTWNKDIALGEENVKWLPWLTHVGTAHRPYKSGEEALFVAGTNKVGKIRITNGDFSWVDEVMIPDFEYETPTSEQITQTVEEMMAAGNDEEKYLPLYAKHVKDIRQSSANIAYGIYCAMDHEGNYFVGWGTSMHRVSDKIPGDINSGIEITRSFNLKDGLPPEEAKKISRIMAMGMTYDGFIAVAMPGIIAVLDRDLGNI